jgi:hypothetical protein
MLHMCVFIHSRFIENYLIWILGDRPIISEVLLSHSQKRQCQRCIPQRRCQLSGTVAPACHGHAEQGGEEPWWRWTKEVGVFWLYAVAVEEADLGMEGHW